jgi:hypothetical protein
VLRASRYAVPRQMKVIQTVKKSELKASVERMVRIHRRKVKMNQAKIWKGMGGLSVLALHLDHGSPPWEGSVQLT